MKTEYDFSNATRCAARRLPPGNKALREYMDIQNPTLEDTLRRVVRDELKRVKVSDAA